MDAESGSTRPRRRLLLPGAGLAVATILVAVVLGRADPDVRISFERFALDSSGNLTAAFVLEHRGGAAVEAYGGGRRPAANLQTPPAAGGTAWTDAGFLTPCGVGFGWHPIPTGTPIRIEELLIGVDESTFRLRVLGRRATLPGARAVFSAVGRRDLEEFDLVSEAVEWPWRLDRVGEGVQEDEGDLFRAAFLGDVERVRALLARGVPPDRLDPKTGATPLHAAAALGHVAVARLLLGAGAPVDAPAAYDRTPLFWAVGHGRADVVRALVDAGADPGCPTYEKLTPLALAERVRRDDLAALLREAAASASR